MSKTSAMKSSKTLETPKAKAQGEVDYKAKIDKDVLRIGTIKPGPGDYDMCSWHGRKSRLQ